MRAPARDLRSCYDVGMKRRVVGYHTDAENHWVAELECGHGQHVRHDPPWTERPWVTTEEGRAARLGEELNCVRCDEFARKVVTADLMSRIDVNRTLRIAAVDVAVGRKARLQGSLREGRESAR